MSQIGFRSRITSPEFPPARSRIDLKRIVLPNSDLPRDRQRRAGLDENAELDRGGNDASALERARRAFSMIDGILDLKPSFEIDDASLQAWVEERIAERAAARSRRDFVAADAIRAELLARGVAIEDGPSGTKWRKVR